MTKNDVYIIRRFSIWQYLQEEYPVQEEIKDVQTFGRLKLLLFRSVLSVANSRQHTEFVAAAATTMADRLSV